MLTLNAYIHTPIFLHDIHTCTYIYKYVCMYEMGTLLFLTRCTFWRMWFGAGARVSFSFYVLPFGQLENRNEKGMQKKTNTAVIEPIFIFFFVIMIFL